MHYPACEPFTAKKIAVRCLAIAAAAGSLPFHLGSIAVSIPGRAWTEASALAPSDKLTKQKVQNTDKIPTLYEVVFKKMVIPPPRDGCIHP
jgi:hypothetical protein